MKKEYLQRAIIIFIILIIPIFILKEYKVIRASKEGPFIAKQQRFVVNEDQKSFVIISHGRNNSAYVEKHLRSIFNQNYPNYRVYYIDDQSTDQSYLKVKQFLNRVKPSCEVKVYQTGKNHSALDYYLEIVRSCADDEIVIHLESSDWLFNESVLSRLNEVYANSGVWLTYAQYLEYPSYKKGKKDILSTPALSNKKRYPWIHAPAKTYYAKILKQMYPKNALVRQEDLFESSTFNLMETMVKTARYHIRYIPEVLYVHNRFASSEPMQLGFFEKELSKSFSQSETNAQEINLEQTTDIVVFAGDDPKKTEDFLQSISRFVHGDYRIFLMLSTNADFSMPLQPSMYLVKIDNQGFKSAIQNIILDDRSSSRFVIFTTEDVEIHSPIYLNESINALLKTKAYGFYFHLGNNFRDSPTSKVSAAKEIYCWSIADSSVSPDCLQWALYRKREIESDFEQMDFCDQKSLMQQWSQLDKKKRYGLFYKQPKILSNAYENSMNNS